MLMLWIRCSEGVWLRGKSEFFLVFSETHYQKIGLAFLPVLNFQFQDSKSKFQYKK